MVRKGIRDKWQHLSGAPDDKDTQKVTERIFAKLRAVANKDKVNLE